MSTDGLVGTNSYLQTVTEMGQPNGSHRLICFFGELLFDLSTKNLAPGKSGQVKLMGNLFGLKGSWFCSWPVGLESTLRLGCQLLQKYKVYLM